jgi:hypothetical protein
MSQHLALANRLDTFLVSPKIQTRLVLSGISTIRAPIAQLVKQGPCVFLVLFAFSRLKTLFSFVAECRLLPLLQSKLCMMQRCRHKVLNRIFSGRRIPRQLLKRSAIRGTQAATRWDTPAAA